MGYIDLKLKYKEQAGLTEEEKKKEYLFDEILEDSEITILLGAPGSGKTSILRNYDFKHDETQFITVRNFIKIPVRIRGNTSLVLLDGMDEYRGVSEEKDFVVTELGSKINEILEKHQNLKVVISCREMDWYGDEDKRALKDSIYTTKKIRLVGILPLDRKQQYELLKLNNIKDPEKIMEKMADRGFLDNPQLLCMIAKVWDETEDILSKIDIYKRFISLAKEHNAPKNLKDKRNSITMETRFKIIGYLAFYNIFSDIDCFTDEVIEEIFTDEPPFTRKNIELVLNTSIFSERRFIHRTIAEYSLANYLYTNKFDNNLTKSRTYNLFVKDGKIPTEFRGTYAWLCSISRDREFFKVDPYYQAVNGDNTGFPSDVKSEIIYVVKNHAERNPYFFSWDKGMKLEGFYSPELDSILVEELYASLELSNHYIEFIKEIITYGKDLSPWIKERIKEFILDPEIDSRSKWTFVYSIGWEDQFLIDVLNKIKGQHFHNHHEEIKSTILNKLYPDVIGSDEVIKYLDFSESYKSDYTDSYHFLTKTPFDEQYQLVKSLIELRARVEQRGKSSKFSEFIGSYCFEVVWRYRDRYSAEDIYNILKEFKPCYSEYENIEIRPSYYRDISDEDKESRLDGLADELYELFLLDRLASGKRTSPYGNDFNHFYSYTKVKNTGRIYLSVIDEVDDRETKIFLLRSAFWKKDFHNFKDEDILEKVRELGAEKEYELWLNPPKLEWELEHEREEKERVDKINSQKEENEKFYNSKSDDELLNHFGALEWIYSSFYFNKEDTHLKQYISDKTYCRLKDIIKRIVIHKAPWHKDLTISLLAKHSPSILRHLDCIYYSSLALNSNNENSILKYLNTDIEFKKYIYLVSLKGEKSSNIAKVDFYEWLEEENSVFCYDTLQEFLSSYLEHHLKSIKDIILERINQEKDIKVLKELFQNSSDSKSEVPSRFIECFINNYCFNLTIEELKTIKKLNLDSENLKKIDVLIEFDHGRIHRFDKEMVITLSKILKGNWLDNYRNFKELEPGIRVKVLTYMMKEFNTEESIGFRSGLQDPEDGCREFLREHSLSLLRLEELQDLLENFKDNDNIWKSRILNKISIALQKEADKAKKSYRLEELKEFILNDSILSEKDFFCDVVLSLEKLAAEIEDNRDNEIEEFYNKENIKREEPCRDNIYRTLKDKYGGIYHLEREKYEANNRVDMNVAYNENLSFEVQVECKIDDNRGLYTGIEDQLIAKYLSTHVKYGIYLVFYSGSRPDKDKMVKKLEDGIPEEYKNRIKVVSIDLRR